jgi:hypothetical protein
MQENPYQSPKEVDSGVAPPRAGPAEESNRLPVLVGALTVLALVVYFVWLVITQLVIGLLMALMLDGGRLARICGIALLAHWVGIGISLVSRPREPTATDLVLVEYGFVPLFVVVVVIASLLGR